MRQWIGFSSAVALLAIAGCADAHGRTDDAGPTGDAPTPVVCHPGDPSPATFCLFVSSDHVCGDAALQQECVDGAWRCPAGTTSNASCWCSGFDPHPPSCTCTPSGWSCPPDPADGGPPTTCPADPTSAIGSPCSFEGETCGECPTPCAGFCSPIACTDHTWQPLDLGCANPTFPCGPSTWCQREVEYCHHSVSDIGGEPDDYRCQPMPDACDGCACFPSGLGIGCSDDGAGAITFTLGGG